MARIAPERELSVLVSKVSKAEQAMKNYIKNIKEQCFSYLMILVVFCGLYNISVYFGWRDVAPYSWKFIIGFTLIYIFLGASMKCYKDLSTEP